MPVTVFQDDFENNNLNKWTVAEAQWSTQGDVKYAGDYAALGSGGAANRILSYTLPSALEHAKVSFYARVNDVTTGYNVITVPAIALVMRLGNFEYYNGTYHGLPTPTTFIADTWYKIEVEFDASENSIKYWIDDNYKGEVTDLPFASFTEQKFLVAAVADKNIYIDNVTLENMDVAIAGTADAQSTAEAIVSVTRKVSGTADATSTAAATATVRVFIIGTADGQSTASAATKVARKISGGADATSTASATIKVLRKILCTADAQSTAVAAVTVRVFIMCSADGQTTATCAVIVTYAEITPAMHEDLINPYGDMGAWLWLVEIVIPTQATQRIARNTVAVVYGVTSFAAGNFDPPGRIPLAGDGSIPRIQLRVAQDGTGTLEGIVNATKGGENGTVKLIRTCEKYFNSPVKALERTYDILTAGSDPMWVTFSLGIPNPLTQRIPLWSYNSKVCPLATPSLFKGPRCQYPGEDAVCTGLLSDCRTKGNEDNWGAEIGLDPGGVKV